MIGAQKIESHDLLTPISG